MNEFSAKLDGNAAGSDTRGEHASANPGTRFDDGYMEIGGAERTRSRKPRHAGTDNQDISLPVHRCEMRLRD